jgi:hypothetical protein
MGVENSEDRIVFSFTVSKDSIKSFAGISDYTLSKIINKIDFDFEIGVIPVFWNAVNKAKEEVYIEDPMAELCDRSEAKKGK